MWEDLAAKLGSKFDIEAVSAERSEKIMIAARAVYDSYKVAGGAGGGKGNGKRTLDDASAGSNVSSSNNASNKRPAWSNNKHSKQNWSNRSWSK